MLCVTGRFPSDDYGIVFDLFSPGPSKRPRRKEFVHKVFQDTKTLVDIPSFNSTCFLKPKMFNLKLWTLYTQ